MKNSRFIVIHITKYNLLHQTLILLRRCLAKLLLVTNGLFPKVVLYFDQLPDAGCTIC